MFKDAAQHQWERETYIAIYCLIPLCNVEHILNGWRSMPDKVKVSHRRKTDENNKKTSNNILIKMHIAHSIVAITHHTSDGKLLCNAWPSCCTHFRTRSTPLFFLSLHWCGKFSVCFRRYWNSFRNVQKLLFFCALHIFIRFVLQNNYL